MKYKIADKFEADTRSNRDAYIEAMLELMAKNDKIVHVECDLGNCINLKKIQEAYPGRVFNAGIAEQNAVASAGGMAASGLIPFVHSFGCFASRRVFDQAFLAVGYSQVPVHIVGSDPGVTAEFNGATHMPFEDGGLYLNVPNAVIFDSCDYAQTYSVTKLCAAYPEISYLRLIRKGVTKVYEDGAEFEIGKGVTVRDGSDVTIIASGIMLAESLKAAQSLAKEGISARVIDMFCWKPLDEELIIKAAKETGAIVTAENHQIGTGLGSQVANTLVRNFPVPVESVGILNRYGQVGPKAFLMEEYNLLAKDVQAAVKKVLKRK